MKPAGDDQRGDAADDACYLGQPNQLVIRRCWHGRDPGPVEAVVASPQAACQNRYQHSLQHRTATDSDLPELSADKQERHLAVRHNLEGAFHLGRESITVL